MAMIAMTAAMAHAQGAGGRIRTLAIEFAQ